MSRRSKIGLLVLGCIVFLLLASQTPLLSRVRGWSWDWWVKSTARVFSVGPLETDEGTQEQLHALRTENVRLKAEHEEFRRLKEQLAIPAYDSFRTITAHIVGRPLDTYRVQYIINRGSNDGVTLGAPIVVYDGALVGFITALSENTATVQLLLHPSTNLPVEIVGENAPRGLLVGQRYTTLAVTTIPRDASLNEGQNVVSSAREGLPAGLLIGNISSIQREENEAYQSAAVTLPYDPDALQAVSILVLP